MSDAAADVTLCILVGRPDLPFLPQTIPHIVRSNRFRFARRLLIVDTMPPARHQSRDNLADRNRALLAACEALRASDVVDEVLQLGADPEFERKVTQKHFGRPCRERRDFRGIPLLGWVYGIEKATTDYVLHFDSDILIHQSPDYDWISQAKRMMEMAGEILTISPLPGPPAESGKLEVTDSYTEDPRGFYSFKAFSSRRFLIDRRRLQTLLPLTPLYASPKRRLLARLTGGSAIWNWEHMMSHRMQNTPFVRSYLRSGKAWTLHAPDHGPRFVDTLPGLIQKIERGEYPPAQAGKYDLLIDVWRAAL